MAKKDSTYKTARYGNCTYSLILDKRHPKKDRDTFPVAMRYTIDRKSWYSYVAGEFTESDFAKICSMNAKAVRSELYDRKLVFDAIFDEQVAMMERLGGNLTLERIKSAVTGIGDTKDSSFIGVWEDIIHHLVTDNGGERCTTGYSYQYALKSFQTIMWNKPVEGFKIYIDER